MVYMYHSFLIHLSADGHLGCFHVLTPLIFKSFFDMEHFKKSLLNLCFSFFGYVFGFLATRHVGSGLP